VPKLVVFNDPHYSRTEPECRAPSYPQEILEKLHAVARIARKIEAPAIACTGDWFHRKGRVTFHEQGDLLAVLSGWRAAGITPLGILGNHDVPGLAHMDTRASGGLFHSKVLQLLDLEPWSDGSVDEGYLYVTGTSYFHGCDATDEARARMYGAPPPEGWDPKLGDEQRSSDAYQYQNGLHVHLAHGALMLRGDFPDDFSSPEQLVPILHAAGRLPDVIVSGHLHFPEEVRRIPRPDGRGDVTFFRVGSLGRVSRDDLDRIPSALVIATAKRELVHKVVPIGKPVAAPEVSPNDPRDPREHEQRIREFAQKLREEAEVLSLEDNAALVRAIAEKQGHGEKVIARVLAAIEGVA
jgi:hypothetical protein